MSLQCGNTISPVIRDAYVARFEERPLTPPRLRSPVLCGGFEPNSTDPRTGESIFDPRVALNATKAVSVEP